MFSLTPTSGSKILNILKPSRRNTTMNKTKLFEIRPVVPEISESKQTNNHFMTIHNIKKSLYNYQVNFQVGVFLSVSVMFNI